MVGVWWLLDCESHDLLPVIVWHSQCALCRSPQTEERSGCVWHEPTTMDTKASIPGLLPPQVASCCSALHFPSYKQGKLMVVMNWDWLVYLPCHLPTDFHSMWLWIAQQQLPVCTPTQSHPVLWNSWFCNHGNLVVYHVMMMAWYNWAYTRRNIPLAGEDHNKAS